MKKETWVEVEGSEFKSGVDYIARIRCKTPDSLQVYMSTWSEWSATTEYSVPPGLEQDFKVHSEVGRRSLSWRHAKGDSK